MKTIYLEDNITEELFEIKQGESRTVGRGRDCDIMTDPNYREVSRLHFEVRNSTHRTPGLVIYPNGEIHFKRPCAHDFEVYREGRKPVEVEIGTSILFGEKYLMTLRDYEYGQKKEKEKAREEEEARTADTQVWDHEDLIP